MTNLLHLSIACPICKGGRTIKTPWGGEPACGFCLGLGIVYAKDGEAARVRRDSGRDVVERTMKHWEGIP